MILHSERLRFEPMSQAPYDGLRVLNGDPEVMRHISGQPGTPGETRASIARVRARRDALGYSWRSLIEEETGELVGAGCIEHLGHDPANEHGIGWGLRPDRWGRGYAIEAAARMTRFAFEGLEAPLLCAICDPDSARPSSVMEKLGMRLRGRETWHGQPALACQIDRATWQARLSS